MKGIVFTEFMDMVDTLFSPEVLDDVIEASNLPNEGGYTSVGTYPHEELVTLLTNLSKHVQVPVPDLLTSYGKHLFKRFNALYGVLFENIDNAFQFMKNIEDYIHVEVKKLYPDAELPSFSYEQADDSHLTLHYHSPRHFTMFAYGLILGCIEHFDESIEVTIEDRSSDAGGDAIFKLTKTAQ